jgi:hypothetical protein
MQNEFSSVLHFALKLKPGLADPEGYFKNCLPLS